MVTALAAAVVGTVLRWMADPGLWLDEALGANIADLHLGDLVDALRRDGHPPLYPVLLKGWMGVFGGGDLAVRSLSMVLATITLPLAWLAGRRLAGPSPDGRHSRCWRCRPSPSATPAKPACTPWSRS